MRVSFDGRFKADLVEFPNLEANKRIQNGSAIKTQNKKTRSGNAMANEKRTHDDENDDDDEAENIS